MEKDADAFRTISEVAEELDLPQHVLRFWEMRFPQIKPMKRSGGRRYYRREDVDLLRGIKRLLYGEGYTIKGVQRILKEQGARAVSVARTGAAASAENRPGRLSPTPEPIDAAGPDPDGGWRDPVSALSQSQARLLRAAVTEIEECMRLLNAALET